MTISELDRKMDSLIADFHSECLDQISDDDSLPITMADFNNFVDRTAGVLSSLRESIIDYLNDN